MEKSKLVEKSRACDNLVQEIAERTKVATDKKAAAKEKEKEIVIFTREINAEKASAEEALAEALPALEEAALALDNLKKADITEIRSFAKPPKLVEKVCECVVALRGIKDISWKSAKALMADVNFLKELKELDCDNITAGQQKIVQEIIDGMGAPGEDVISKVEAVSKAGSGLFRFVVAVMGYCAVYKEVKPKKLKVAALEKTYEKNKKDLDKVIAETLVLEEQLRLLSEKYDSAMLEKAKLQEEADLMERRVIATDKL